MKHIFVSLLTYYRRLQWNKDIANTDHLHEIPMLSLAQLKDHAQLKRHPIFLEQTIPSPKVQVYPQEKSLLVITKPSIFPAVEWVDIGNATVFGNSEFFLTQGKIIYHDLIDLTSDYFSEELHLRATIFPNKKSMYWHKNLYGDPSTEIPEAIHLLSATSHNYAHWLTEILPKIAIISNSKYYQSVPLLIDENLHENIKQSIRSLVDMNRKIIEVKNHSAIKVKKLIVIGVTGYVTFQPRGKSTTCQVRFSPLAFENLRAQINKKLCVAVTHQKKLFIKRTSTARNLANQQEVELFLEKQHFTTVCPEKLSFFEQVLLFQSASIIVGATGAGLANIIFSPKRCRVIILIAEHPKMVYPYWLFMGEAASIQVEYVFGKGDFSSVHADFSIKIQDLKDALTVS